MSRITEAADFIRQDTEKFMAAHAYRAPEQIPASAKQHMAINGSIMRVFEVAETAEDSELRREVEKMATAFMADYSGIRGL